MSRTFDEFITDTKVQVDSALHAKMTSLDTFDTQLVKAMSYSLLLGGKRIRPALLSAAAMALGCQDKSIIDCSCAIEAIHTYSLIHDDLPAMDDDDLRRGQPSCHKAFDEATAILAGDALQTLAFEWLCESATLSDSQKTCSFRILTKASGSKGMVQGQAMDLACVNLPLTIEQLETMHLLKTGALISASVELGALCAGADDTQIRNLRTYAQAIGLAFQVQDDILDVTGNVEQLGKLAGSDAKLNKPTYVSLLGLEGAQHKSQQLMQQAIDALASFDSKADALRMLAQHIVKRHH